ncbi:MAG TPA: hypothetical protein DEQ34_12675 [Balneolaceae bacterium]|nr:hypothetical protein [Balneolaceae bacterium]|tara:strand:+ start:164296 stop:164535 length:240 start_codon:yes stop_codon:yes gene_type:complete
MLKTFFDSLGFFGSLSLSLFIFTLGVFWIAGIAGITLPVDGGKRKYNTWQVAIAVLIPIYPIVWMISDIIAQYRFMKNN